MIPRANIVAWRQTAPWVSDVQVEHDLVLSRALVALFVRPAVAAHLAFRGGTALHKLHFRPARRYSEDIDLVQVDGGPIGPILDEIRTALGPFLGKPKTDRKEGGATVIYRFMSEGPQEVPLRLKVEINTREHFSVDGRRKKGHRVDSPWFSGGCEVNTFTLEELLATKLRALYQRRKGRDLFDLWLALSETKADPVRVVDIFQHYMAFGRNRVTREDFRKNLALKVVDQRFVRDMAPLLAADRAYDVQAAHGLVVERLIERLDP